METLRVALADWTDFDASAHLLAQCLGIMPSQQEMKEAKWVYWSENPLGTMLYSSELRHFRAVSRLSHI
jgi:hypothetical protein